jgi:hypothetical protein
MLRICSGITFRKRPSFPEILHEVFKVFEAEGGFVELFAVEGLGETCMGVLLALQTGMGSDRMVPVRWFTYPIPRRLDH